MAKRSLLGAAAKGVLSGVPLVAGIADSLRSALPTLEDEATVTVWGVPGASRAELYFLAAAVGFSLVKRHDIFDEFFLPSGMILCQWDAADNYVTFVIKYKTCLTTSSWDKGWAEIRTIPVYGGPPNSVSGASWNFVADIGGGVPTDPADAGEWKVVAGGAVIPTKRAPVVPFAGRPVLTTDQLCSNPDPTAGTDIVFTPNVRPILDNRSRSVEMDLVYSALTGQTGVGRKTFTPPAAPNLFAGK